MVAVLGFQEITECPSVLLIYTPISYMPPVRPQKLGKIHVPISLPVVRSPRQYQILSCDPTDQPIHEACRRY